MSINRVLIYFHLDIIGIVIVAIIGGIISLCASIIPANSSYKVNAIEELRKGDS